jgi:hypothetical protein
MSQWFFGKVPSSCRHVFCPKPGISQQITDRLYPSADSEMFFVDSVPIFVLLCSQNPRSDSTHLWIFFLFPFLAVMLS